MFNDCDVTAISSHIKAQGFASLTSSYDATQPHVADVIAQRSCFNSDFLFLFVLINNGASLSDYVIVEKMNTNIADDSVAIAFLQCVFKTSNCQLKEKVARLFFEFNCDLLRLCLEHDVDPTEMSGKSRATVASRSHLLLRIQRRSALLESIKTLIESANSFKMLQELVRTWRTLEDGEEKENVKAVERDSDAQISAVMELLREADARVVEDAKLSNCEQAHESGSNCESLKQLCRKSVRYNCNANMLYARKQLPLPTALQEFLVLR